MSKHPHAIKAQPYRPDLEPGFWPNYKEPTPLAKAIQYPIHDPHWQNRVLNGYAQTRLLALKDQPHV